MIDLNIYTNPRCFQCWHGVDIDEASGIIGRLKFAKVRLTVETNKQY